MLLTNLFLGTHKPQTIFEIVGFDPVKIYASFWLTTFMLLVLVLVLVLIFYLVIKKRKGKSKAFLKTHVNKKLGIAWNLLTSSTIDYKPINTLEQFADNRTDLLTLVTCFEDNFLANQEIITTSSPKSVLFNLNSLFGIVKKVQYSLNTLDIRDIDNSSIKLYGKPSEKDLQSINGIYNLLEDFKRKTAIINKFDALQSAKEKFENLDQMKFDLNYLIEHKKDLAELMNSNKEFIESLRPYFD